MNEEKIIQGIKNRDEKSLRAFIDSYGPVMKASIYKVLTFNENVRMEVLNDSVLAVWDNIDSFDPARSSFKNWCAGVARYKAIDALRKEIRHKSVDLDEVSPYLSTDDDISIDETEEILKVLDEKDREIFRKLFLEGYSYDDLAKVYDISKAGLYNRVARGKKKIKEEIQNEKCL
ncbi:sigma-70 family RNA polymerase sigma factor [Anaerococcus lactolyticus]|uniref:ECF subfamily RNA polymerase sigma-24 factor n=1 Tax=Anaerococcus lactolyticus S7-1-13 TaxID=1284686 RepID=A0A095Z8M0_9FIRM|nr:sigma-70 family RNA polymerase sigma factor [Anaerococcus lactolyticus]KGF04779.1 ECF subfamily RNA polymerase sigma-24 factor [Anaerococcus lactolyticus S7-1-13]